MKSQPTVSFVLPVYKDEPYLGEALESIYSQTYDEIEVVIVAESVSYATRELIPSDRPNIGVVDVSEGTGLSSALNKGIEAASGDLIARLDADDRCRPERIEKQVQFLQDHEEVDLLGTASRQIDKGGSVFSTYYPPTDDAVLRWESLFSCPFVHSSAIFDRKIYESGCRYRDGDPYDSAEDYDLWMQIMSDGEAANLAEPLVDYREHEGSLSQKQSEKQISNFTTLAHRTIANRCPTSDLSESELERIHRAIYRGGDYDPEKFSDRVNITCKYLDTLNQFLNTITDDPGIRKIAAKRALHTLGRPEEIDINVMRAYLTPFRVYPLLPIEIVRRVLS